MVLKPLWKKSKCSKLADKPWARSTHEIQKKKGSVRNNEPRIAYNNIEEKGSVRNNNICQQFSLRRLPHREGSFGLEILRP